MINLVFSIEIRGSSSHLVDIKMLESRAGDNHVVCGSEGYQSEEILVHCKATPKFVPKSMATIVNITGTEICSSLTCPSDFLESNNISFIIFENNFQLRNGIQFVKRSYIPDTDSQIVGLNSFAGGIVIRGIFSVFIGMLVFVAAPKACAQPQNLRSYFAVRIRYSANWC